MAAVFAAITTVALVMSVSSMSASAAGIPSFPPDPLPAPAANPVLGPECHGLNVALLMDASGSVRTAGAEQTVKDSAWALVNGLEDTGASLTVTHFATGVKTWATNQPVDATTTGPGGSLYTAIESYKAGGATSAWSTPAPQQYQFKGIDVPAPSTLNPLDPANYNGPGGYAKDATNWQMALETAIPAKPDLVILLTDGEPTAVHSSGLDDAGMAPDPYPGAVLQKSNTLPMVQYGYYKAMLAANALKADGSRLLVVGVGPGNYDQANAVTRMQGVAGPNPGQSAAEVWTNRQPLDIDQFGVVYVNQWDALEAAMHKLAEAVAQCAPKPVGDLTVSKVFDPAESGFAGTFEVTVDCEIDDYDRTLQLAGGQTATIAGIPAGTSCTVAESALPTAPSGWSWGQPTLNPADGKVTIAQGSTATVTVSNSISAPPSIDLVKTADVASFDEAGDVITYTFTVTNTGLVTLSDVVIDDPLPGLSELTCEPGVLAPGGQLTCTATYRVTQADLDASGVDNTATATGTGPAGDQVTDTDSVKVPGQPREGEIPSAGAGNVAALGVLALLLMGLGTGLVYARRRSS